MRRKQIFFEMIGWIFFGIVMSLGLLNLILVHPVPGMVYLLLSLVFLPPVSAYVESKFTLRIPATVKILLGIVIVWFTLGISDLAEMFGL